MRYLIYFIGVLIAAIFFTQAKSAYGHRSLLLNSNQSIVTEVGSLTKTLDWLSHFHTQPPQSLMRNYQDFLNNVYLIANGNQAVVLIKNEAGGDDKGIKITSKDSFLIGVSQVDLDITVGDLTNFNKLSAIFNAFSELEKTTPVIIHGFFQEKDYLIFNVSVLGV